MALTADQQAYYNQLIANGGDPTANLGYVSGLNDAQAAASLAAIPTGGTPTVLQMATASGLPMNNDNASLINQVLYDNIGANLDTRNWSSIMGASNPLQSGWDALTSMYSDPAYQMADTANLIARGYDPTASGNTFSQMLARVGTAPAGLSSVTGTPASGGNTGGLAPPATPGGGALPGGGAGGSFGGLLGGAGGTGGGLGGLGTGGFSFGSSPFGSGTPPTYTSTLGAAPTLHAVGNQPNPYLAQQADEIARRSGLALQDDMNGIRSGAIATGGYGGSRQGVAQGVATGRSLDSLQGNLANLYGTDYTNQANRNLQQYGQDSQNYAAQRAADLQKYGLDLNQYNTGRAQDLSLYGINTNAALGLNGQNQQFYLGNRQLDGTDALIGANLYGQGNAGFLSQGSGLQNLGATQNTAPWQNLNNYTNLINQYTGLSGQTTTTQGGGGATGAIGGALAGGQIANNLGFGSAGAGGTNSSLNYGPSQNASLYGLDPSFNQYLAP